MLDFLAGVFPRLIIPLSVVCSGLNLVVQFVCFIAVLHSLRQYPANWVPASLTTAGL
jgi:hypothetical protein